MSPISVGMDPVSELDAEIVVVFEMQRQERETGSKNRHIPSVCKLRRNVLYRIDGT